MKTNRYKAWLAAIFAAVLLFTSSALAASCGLSSQKTDKGALITWNGSRCRSSCTLTLYRDGWPVKCASVSGAKGQCLIPNSYLKKAGTYTVRLKSGNACETITIGTAGKKTDAKTDAPSTDVPSTDEPSSGGVTSSSAAEQVIRLVNAERAKQGIAPLTQSRGADARRLCARRGDRFEIQPHAPGRYGVEHGVFHRLRREHRQGTEGREARDGRVDELQRT